MNECYHDPDEYCRCSKCGREIHAFIHIRGYLPCCTVCGGSGRSVHDTTGAGCGCYGEHDVCERCGMPKDIV